MHRAIIYTPLDRLNQKNCVGFTYSGSLGRLDVFLQRNSTICSASYSRHGMDVPSKWPLTTATAKTRSPKGDYLISVAERLLVVIEAKHQNYRKNLFRPWLNWPKPTWNRGEQPSVYSSMRSSTNPLKVDIFSWILKVGGPLVLSTRSKGCHQTDCLSLSYLFFPRRY